MSTEAQTKLFDKSIKARVTLKNESTVVLEKIKEDVYTLRENSSSYNVTSLTPSSATYSPTNLSSTRSQLIPMTPITGFTSLTKINSAGKLTDQYGEEIFYRFNKTDVKHKNNNDEYLFQFMQKYLRNAEGYSKHGYADINAISIGIGLNVYSNFKYSSDARKFKNYKTACKHFGIIKYVEKYGNLHSEEENKQMLKTKELISPESYLNGGGRYRIQLNIERVKSYFTAQDWDYMPFSVKVFLCDLGYAAGEGAIKFGAADRRKSIRQSAIEVSQAFRSDASEHIKADRLFQLMHSFSAYKLCTKFLSLGSRRQQWCMNIFDLDRIDLDKSPEDNEKTYSLKVYKKLHKDSYYHALEILCKHKSFFTNEFRSSKDVGKTYNSAYRKSFVNVSKIFESAIKKGWSRPDPARVDAIFKKYGWKQ